MKLHQVIALLADKKKTAQSAITKAYHILQKDDLLKGISRVYMPKDDDGEHLPAEKKNVQQTVKGCVESVRSALVPLYDFVVTQDVGNSTARANVIVDGKVILEDIPATTLIFLEKQLDDLKTFIDKMPVLDPAFNWEYDLNSGSYRSDPIETTRSKKVPRNHIKAEATKEHPAQVEIFNEDVVIGTWNTKHFSGAVPADLRTGLLAKVTKLRDAVIIAREEANRVEVQEKPIGDSIFDYLFWPRNTA